MPRPRIARGLLAACCAALVASAAIVAQELLASIATTEAAACDWVLEVFKHAGPNKLTTWDSGAGPQIEAMLRLPPAVRVSTTTRLYAWTKTYLNSASFKEAYAQWRTEQTPQVHEHAGTVEEELKEKIKEFNESQAASYKMLESIGQKAQADQMRKEAPQLLAQLAGVWRTELTEHRAKDKVDYDTAVTYWRKFYPPDPMTRVADILREFLATTADIDFTAKQKTIRNGIGGITDVFENEAYNKKPWQWQFSYPFGSETIAAARAAAQAWLKELPAK